MTREKEIIEKASKESEIYYKVNDNYGDCFHGGFIDGARWADEHPKPEMVNKQEFIEKACEWLRENMSRYVSRDDPDKFPYGFPTRAFRVGVNFECDFKKAMEE